MIKFLIMKERILDLGIGLGGSYLLENPQDSVRVGMDKDERKLFKKFPERFKKGALLLLADADISLPFEDKSFDRVQILFPNDELYFGLCSKDHNLWPEIRRILDDRGRAEVIFDVPAVRFAVPEVRGWLELIFFPHRKMVAASKRFGFQSNLRRLTCDEVCSLGTGASKAVAERTDLSFFFRTDPYCLSARKE
jgi:hypothetical protein